MIITLDLDGTLEDSRADMVSAIQRVRASLGLPPGAYADWVPHVSKGMDHLYRTCFPGHDVVAEYAAEYGAHIADQTRLYDGWAEALPELAARATLAVVTNKPEALSEQLLDALGVRRHFAAVVGGDSCAAPKPDPVMLAEAVARCGGSETVVHVGDSAGDQKLARAYGATAVWCSWGYLAEMPEAATQRVDHPRDLLRFVE